MKLPVALLVAITPVAWASAAAAQTPCNIPPAGEVLCEEVVIDTTIRVRAYDAASATPTGYLHIRAGRITITESGEIDATGSGYATQVVSAIPTHGAGPGGGQRGIQLAAGVPEPGGGGAHIGIGGQGALDKTLCTLSTSAFGGSAYDDVSAPAALVSPFDPLLAMGSAGGASFCGDSGDQVRAGGRGGGIVILTAATIELSGRVLANGEGLQEMSSNLQGCGPGAGAGGSIILSSHQLTLGANALLSARGGESPRTLDALMMDATNSWGGGGGGGLVTLFVSAGAAGLNSNVAGGAADCLGGVGGDGAVAVLDPPSCVDADLDGFASDVCGGGDCNDGSTTISPDGVESCDGLDNDCDGDVDEDPDSLCPAGSGTTCIDGACAVPSGQGGSDGTLPPPPEVVLGGGLCAMRPGHRESTPWSLLALLGVLIRRRVARNRGR
jgi:hypothetical protein